MCSHILCVSASNNDPAFRILSPKVGEHARFITRNAETDTEKAQMLFEWMAQHIDYDIKAAAMLNEEPFLEWQAPETVLRRGKAVCQGYTATYSAFLDAVNIQNYVVHGDARSLDSPEPELSAHCWNAVFINNQWYLVEPTWAAGGVNNGVFVKDYRAEYFKISPEELIKTHLPDDPMWQLLSSPISRSAFMEKTFLADGRGDYDYKSQLEEFFTLDAMQRNQVSTERALLFYPENSAALYELAVLQFDQAMIPAKAYETKTAHINQPEEFLQLREILLDLLEQQESLLEDSKATFEQLLQHSDSYTVSVQENLIVIRSVIKNINFERRFLSEL